MQTSLFLLYNPWNSKKGTAGLKHINSLTAVDIGQFTAPLTVLGVPEITIRFGDQPERLTGLGIQSYSWLRFVAERIQNKISPKKPHEAKSRGNKLFRHKFSRLLTQWSYTGHAFFLQHRIVTVHVMCCLPGKLIRDSGSLC